MQKILEQIAVTAELMGQAITPAAAAIMARDLSIYPQNMVIEALGLVRRESKGRLSLAVVIEKLEELSPDGRPGADEAWAMIPHDEFSSVVMSEEMAEAMSIARPLLCEGDKIGARMAFKEAYNRIVEQNKRSKIPPKWFPSLGIDKESRQEALSKAVRLGRITQDHALSLISPEQGRKLIESNEPRLQIEHKKLSQEEIKANIEKMKQMLAKSKLCGKHE